MLVRYRPIWDVMADMEMGIDHLLPSPWLVLRQLKGGGRDSVGLCLPRLLAVGLSFVSVYHHVVSISQGRVPGCLATSLLKSSELQGFRRCRGEVWRARIPRPSASAHLIENHVWRRCLDGTGLALKDRAVIDHEIGVLGVGLRVVCKC